MCALPRGRGSMRPLLRPHHLLLATAGAPARVERWFSRRLLSFRGSPCANLVRIVAPERLRALSHFVAQRSLFLGALLASTVVSGGATWQRTHCAQRPTASKNPIRCLVPRCFGNDHTRCPGGAPGTCAAGNPRPSALRPEHRAVRTCGSAGGHTSRSGCCKSSIVSMLLDSCSASAAQLRGHRRRNALPSGGALCCSTSVSG